MIPIPSRPKTSIKSIQGASPELITWGTNHDKFTNGVVNALIAIQREIQEFRTMVGGQQQPTTAKRSLLFGQGPFTAGHLASFVDASGKSIQDAGSAAAAAISGPGLSVVGDIVVWNNTLGTAVSDTGIVAANVVIGPASATSGNIATFNGTTGKLIQDGGVLASRIVVGPASATDNAIVRFDGTTGKLIQDYTSGAPTVDDTGIVAISAGLTLTGAATNTSTYSVGTNQTNFISTVADVAGNYGFDFKDTIGSATTGARTGTSYFFVIRDRTGQSRFLITAPAKATGSKIIIGGSAVSSTISQSTWTFQDNATGTSADPGLKVVGTSGSATFTAGTANKLNFLAGSATSQAPPLGFFPDGSGVTANDNYILFQKTNAWANAAANDWMQWDWFSGFGGPGPTGANRMWSAIIDATYSMYMSQGGRWGNNGARVGYAFDGTNWISWDLLVGGGFGATVVGATEPIV